MIFNVFQFDRKISENKLEQQEIWKKKHYFDYIS